MQDVDFAAVRQIGFYAQKSVFSLDDRTMLLFPTLWQVEQGPFGTDGTTSGAGAFGTAHYFFVVGPQADRTPFLRAVEDGISIEAVELADDDQNDNQNSRQQGSTTKQTPQHTPEPSQTQQSEKSLPSLLARNPRMWVQDPRMQQGLAQQHPLARERLHRCCAPSLFQSFDGSAGFLRLAAFAREKLQQASAVATEVLAATQEVDILDVGSRSSELLARAKVIAGAGKRTDKKHEKNHTNKDGSRKSRRKNNENENQNISASDGTLLQQSDHDRDSQQSDGERSQHSDFSVSSSCVSRAGSERGGASTCGENREGVPRGGPGLTPEVAAKVRLLVEEYRGCFFQQMKIEMQSDAAPTGSDTTKTKTNNLAQAVLPARTSATLRNAAASAPPATDPEFVPPERQAAGGTIGISAVLAPTAFPDGWSLRPAFDSQRAADIKQTGINAVCDALPPPPTGTDDSNSAKKGSGAAAGVRRAFFTQVKAIDACRRQREQRRKDERAKRQAAASASASASQKNNDSRTRGRVRSQSPRDGPSVIQQMFGKTHIVTGFANAVSGVLPASSGFSSSCKNTDDRDQKKSGDEAEDALAALGWVSLSDANGDSTLLAPIFAVRAAARRLQEYLKTQWRFLHQLEAEMMERRGKPKGGASPDSDSVDVSDLVAKLHAWELVHIGNSLWYLLHDSDIHCSIKELLRTRVFNTCTPKSLLSSSEAGEKEKNEQKEQKSYAWDLTPSFLPFGMQYGNRELFAAGGGNGAVGAAGPSVSADDGAISQPNPSAKNAINDGSKNATSSIPGASPNATGATSADGAPRSVRYTKTDDPVLEDLVYMLRHTADYGFGGTQLVTSRQFVEWQKGKMAKIASASASAKGTEGTEDCSHLTHNSNSGGTKKANGNTNGNTTANTARTTNPPLSAKQTKQERARAERERQKECPYLDPAALRARYPKDTTTGFLTDELLATIIERQEHDHQRVFRKEIEMHKSGFGSGSSQERQIEVAYGAHQGLVESVRYTELQEIPTAMRYALHLTRADLADKILAQHATSSASAAAGATSNASNGNSNGGKFEKQKENHSKLSQTKQPRGGAEQNEGCLVLLGRYIHAFGWAEPLEPANSNVEEAEEAHVEEANRNINRNTAAGTAAAKPGSGFALTESFWGSVKMRLFHRFQSSRLGIGVDLWKLKAYYCGGGGADMESAKSETVVRNNVDSACESSSEQSGEAEMPNKVVTQKCPWRDVCGVNATCTSI